MIKLSKQMMLIAFLASAALIGCEKKEQNSVEKTDALASIEDYEKLIKFIAITKSVTEDEVLFDSKKNEFYLSGIPYKIRLEEIQKIYDISNEYKLKYEFNLSNK